MIAATSGERCKARAIGLDGKCRRHLGIDETAAQNLLAYRATVDALCWRLAGLHGRLAALGQGNAQGLSDALGRAAQERCALLGLGRELEVARVRLVELTAERVGALLDGQELDPPASGWELRACKVVRVAVR